MTQSAVAAEIVDTRLTDALGERYLAYALSTIKPIASLGAVTRCELHESEIHHTVPSPVGVVSIRTGIGRQGHRD